jgi:DNA-binding beta-propeller fold protein YncE
MKKPSHQQPWLVGSGLALGAVAALLIAATGGTGTMLAGHKVDKGGPRLVKIEALPEMNATGEMCQFMSASAGAEQTLLAMAQARGQAAGSAAADPRNLIQDRPPLRVIKDPYPTYSAVAMDFKNEEIVLLDENLFQILAYDRTANTPAKAAMTEPKRVIAGHQTKVEFNCGLYIDQKNGDIYAVNNDTLDTLVVFSREAKGDVPPTRELHTPHRTYGIAVDEAKQEMYLTVQDSPMIVVYHKYAAGQEKPKRVIRGNKTQMADVHGIALDTKNGWIFVANYGNGAYYEEGGDPTAGLLSQRPRGINRPGDAPAGGTAAEHAPAAPAAAAGAVSSGSEDNDDERGGLRRKEGSGYFTEPSITVYKMTDSGDVEPARVIKGNKTMLNWPAHIFFDEERNDLYVANDGGDNVLVFKGTDNGNVAPTRVIAGKKSNVKNPTGVYVDPVNKEIVVSNMGNHMATVYPIDANGDVAPKRIIRGAPLDTPALQIGNPGAVAYDTKRDEILVPN